MRVHRSVYGRSCSSVAFGGTSMAPKTTPWSSFGRELLAGENMYMRDDQERQRDPDACRRPDGARSVAAEHARRSRP